MKIGELRNFSIIKIVQKENISIQYFDKVLPCKNIIFLVQYFYIYKENIKRGRITDDKTRNETKSHSSD